MIGSPTETEEEDGRLGTLGSSRGTGRGALTNGGDGFAERHDAPGAAEEEAAAVEQTGGEAQQLLEPLLPDPPVAALLEDHLLVGIILPKRVHWDQVRPGGGTHTHITPAT